MVLLPTLHLLSLIALVELPIGTHAQGLLGLGGLLGGGGNRRAQAQNGGSNAANQNGGLNLNIPLLNLNLRLGGSNNGNRNGIPESSTLKPGGPESGQEPCLFDNENCQDQAHAYRPFVPENKLEKLGITWKTGRVNGSGVYVPNNDGQSRFYFIADEQDNLDYGRCRTPLNQGGHCRHLEHCVQDEFRNDYLAFLQYVCYIENRYVGVCCPETSNPGTEPAGGSGDPGFFRPPGRPGGPPNQKPKKPKNPNRGGPNRPNKPHPNRPRPINTTPQSVFTSESPAEEVDFGEGVQRRDCGLSEKQVSRVVGGRKADPKAWPWMAALLRADSGSEDSRAGQYCGGVLIGEYHVLTAAHCCDGFEPKELKIRLGEYNFNQTSDIRRDFDVVDIKLHEEYNRYSYKNDIALIKLAKSAFYTKEVRSICLPKPRRNPDFTNEVGIVTGWGTIYYGGPHSATLTEVLVPIWKQEDCKSAYTQPIEETNLCAGVRAGGRDSCQGDSGGPLQLEIDGYWSVVGIVSWGIRCAEPGYPGVYTRTTKYMDWIQSNMKS